MAEEETDFDKAVVSLISGVAQIDGALAMNVWHAVEPLVADRIAEAVHVATKGAVRDAMVEIDRHVQTALAEVEGADYETVLIATVNAYSTACRALIPPQAGWLWVRLAGPPSSLFAPDEGTPREGG